MGQESRRASESDVRRKQRVVIGFRVRSGGRHWSLRRGGSDDRKDRVHAGQIDLCDRIDFDVQDQGRR